MARVPLVIAPDPILKQVSTPVESVTDEVRALIDDMFETMIAADGIGLAAIQVGVPKRILVTNVFENEDDDPIPLRMVNPEIVWRSDEEAISEEGCLSLPDQLAKVARPARVRLRYIDEAGEVCELEAEHMMATCVQHEIDHLEGILFVDHLSRIKRDMIIRKLVKQKKVRASARA
jgi:peptide deformylase